MSAKALKPGTGAVALADYLERAVKWAEDNGKDGLDVKVNPFFLPLEEARDIISAMRGRVDLDAARERIAELLEREDERDSLTDSLIKARERIAELEREATDADTNEQAWTQRIGTLEAALRPLLDAAYRVQRKYGVGRDGLLRDWTEWTDLGQSLADCEAALTGSGPAPKPHHLEGGCLTCMAMESERDSARAQVEPLTLQLEAAQAALAETIAQNTRNHALAEKSLALDEEHNSTLDKPQITAQSWRAFCDARDAYRAEKEKS